MKCMKKLWALLLALVLALALCVTASAETVGAPGGNPYPGNEPTVSDPITEIEFTIEKRVELAGEGTIPAATFTFELTDPDGRSLSDCGLAVRDNTVTLAEDETSGTTVFAISVADADKIRSTWNRDGNNYTKTFRLTEKNDGADGWTYDSQSYDVELTYSDTGDLVCSDCDTRAFRNVYTPAESTVTEEIPFTKVVDLGGNREPGSQTFELEIFDSINSTAGLTITSAVVTNGSGTYQGNLVITGPENDVSVLLGRGFYVREKNGGAANWTYSDAVWHVIRQDGQNATFPATKQTSDNGDYYVDGAAAAMRFTNTYTRTEYGTAEVRIPFTKVVKLGGNREPGSQSFQLEIFGIGNSNTAEYANVTYTASVTTNGAGTYNGEIVITGPENEVESFVCEGFFVREKNGGAANWTYSDALWYVENAGGQYNVYPAVKHTTPNGDSYEADQTQQAAQMRFTNVYTRNHRNIIPSDPGPDEKFVSPKTFDAGIGLYAVSALLSAAGGAWLGGKKRK